MPVLGAFCGKLYANLLLQLGPKEKDMLCLIDEQMSVYSWGSGSPD